MSSIPADSKRTCIVEDRWLAQIMRVPCYRVICAEDLELFRHDFDARRAVKSFFYVSLPDEHHSAYAPLIQCGFYPAEVKVTFVKDRESSFAYQSSAKLGFASFGDEPEVVEVARKNFMFSRFHSDPNISRSVADEIQVVWVKNFFLKKRGTRMVVAHQNGHLAGFNLLIENSDGSLTIDLLAVEKKFAQQKIGSDLMIFAEEHCAQREGGIKVSTQRDNIPAVRLYQKLGYHLHESSITLHFFS